MGNAPFVISTCALAFTVFSFWWLHWRQARILVVPPRTYDAGGERLDPWFLVLPLGFFNLGAAPIVVQNLRLRFTDTPGTWYSFQATVSRLATSSGEERKRNMATQFVVKGRDGAVLFCEFQRDPETHGTSSRPAGTYGLELQGITGTKARQDWRALTRFELNFPDVEASVRTYDSQGLPPRSSSRAE